MKTGTAISEAHKITAAEVKRKTHKSQAPLTHNANLQPFPTCRLCQQTFPMRNGLVGHLWTQNTSPANPTTASSTTPPQTSMASTTTTVLTTNAHRSRVPPPSIIAIIIIPATTSAATTATATAPTLTTKQNAPDSPPTTTLTFISVDSVLTCPHCDYTFT
nr:unnamed protein product [Spirometra erinaceieuropaei]